MMLNKLKDGLAGQSLEKAQDVIREFNDTVPKIRAVGLSVENVGIKMGIPPEITARLVGSAAALDEKEIAKLAKENEGNKILGAILDALHTAALFKEQLQSVGFKGVTIDVKLGLLPSVEISLLN